MIYPSIDKILNNIDSKYILVHIIAKRAQQMQETNHYQLPISEYKNQKELGRALEELEKGLIKVSN
jgi:DNA-directed RNA polymerase subunit omega